MPDFSQYLQKPANQIEGLKPLPLGTYLCTYTDYNDKERENKKNPAEGPHLIRDLSFQVNDAMEDVDRNALPSNFTQLKIFHGVFVKNPGNLEKQLFSALDLDGVNMAEAFDQGKGRQVLISVKHDPSGDPERPYVKVKTFMKA